MQKIALPFAAALLALAATGANAQQIYKWRDANGQMHIGDTPPPAGTPAKNILSRGGAAPVIAADAASDAASATPAAPISAADAELKKKKAKIDQDKAEAAAAEKAKADQKNADAHAANCAAAQQQIRTLNSGIRIARINANGEREFLDDAAIASQLKQAQAVAAQNCGAQ